jgi:transcriptional regulator with XRE-family HTH domain
MTGEPDPEEPMGQLVARRRKESNLTQKQLAKFTGLSVAQVRGIEAGDLIVSHGVVEVLATVMRLNPYTLAPWTQDDLADGLYVLDWHTNRMGSVFVRRPRQDGHGTEAVIVISDMDRRRIELTVDLPGDDDTALGLAQLINSIAAAVGALKGTQ